MGAEEVAMLFSSSGVIHGHQIYKTEGAAINPSLRYKLRLAPKMNVCISGSFNYGDSSNGIMALELVYILS